MALRGGGGLPRVDHKGLHGSRAEGLWQSGALQVLRDLRDQWRFESHGLWPQRFQMPFFEQSHGDGSLIASRELDRAQVLGKCFEFAERSAARQPKASRPRVFQYGASSQLIL